MNENPFKLTPPTVHLNGTGAQSLVESYDKAARAVQQALEECVQSAPNARDYYVQGNEAYVKARDEHDNRMSALRKVRDELQWLATNVRDQEEARRR